MARGTHEKSKTGDEVPATSSVVKAPHDAPPNFWGRSFGRRGILTRPNVTIWVAVSFLALRVIALFRYDPVTFDSAGYFEIAALMQNGRWTEALAHDYPPLYPLLVAAIQPLVGSAAAAGVLVAAVADVLILFPLMAMARRAGNEDAAWAAAFLWAVHPSAIRLGVQALSDAPTALCVIVALYIGCRALEARRLTWAAAAGAASGLAFLFRPEGLEAAMALAAFYAVCWTPWRHSAAAAGQACGPDDPVVSRRHGRAAIRRMGWIVAPLMGWVLVAGPYVAHISVDAGSLTLSKKKSAASFARSVVPAVENPSERAAPHAAPPVTARLSRVAHNLYVFQKPLVNGLNPAVIVLGCAGLAGLLARRVGRWSRTHGLLVGLFALHLGILIGLASDRGVGYVARHHVLLMVVYALPIAGVGLAWVVERLGGRPRAGRWVAATGLGVLVIATAASIIFRGPDQGNSLRSAADWIRSQAAGTPVVVTSLAKLTYHARAERVDMRGTYDDILRRARERSADYIALYPDLVGQTAPDFLTRLSPADLELVKVFPEPTPSTPDQRLELYRLRAVSRGHADQGGGPPGGKKGQ